MRFVRKTLVFFLALILPLFLFTLAIDTGIIRTAGSSGNIKKFLSDSDIYNSLISSTLDQVKTSGGEGEGISLTDPNIKAVAEKTFTPQFLQENTEKVLDSVFLWLDGKTKVPDFKLDLSGLKETFATETAKAAQARAATLPACPAGLSGSADSYEPFSATCLPKGTTPASVAEQIRNSLSSSEGFLKDPVITADIVKLSGSSQSVFADQLKDVPNYYQQVKKTPLYLALLSLLTALGIIFLSASRTRGLRRLGVTLTTIGVFLLISAYTLNWGVNKKLLPQLKIENKAMQETITTLAADIIANINKTYYIFGGTYAALGVLAIAGPMVLGKGKSQRSEPTSDKEQPVETPAAVTKPETIPRAPAPKPKKKPTKKIIIQ
ncbi:hypothetical protein HYW35_02355 [Candidatus Saccharibacteria bacterium]|nr:hypothetical protein [Candidatus Saccharibacteria bacterium]